MIRHCFYLNSFYKIWIDVTHRLWFLGMHLAGGPNFFILVTYIFYYIYFPRNALPTEIVVRTSKVTDKEFRATSDPETDLL